METGLRAGLSGYRIWQGQLVLYYLKCTDRVWFTRNPYVIGTVSYFSTGHAMAQLVEALRCKPEGRGFDSRWCHWNYSSTKSFRSLYDPGVDSVSNRNEYQEYFVGGGGKGGRCLGLTTLPTSCADCLEIWELQPPGTLRACPGL